MFQIRDEHLCALAQTCPDTIGMLVTGLAIPLGTGLESVEFEPGSGWRTCETSKLASARWPEAAAMQSYIDESSSIVMTCVDAGSGEIEILAEGNGWSIHSDDIYAGWTNLP